jgi:hypothetical protein
VAEGGGLLNRYRVEKLYRGFESLSLRQNSPGALNARQAEEGVALAKRGLHPTVKISGEIFAASYLADAACAVHDLKSVRLC